MSLWRRKQSHLGLPSSSVEEYSSVFRADKATYALCRRGSDDVSNLYLTAYFRAVCNEMLLIDSWLDSGPDWRRPLTLADDVMLELLFPTFCQWTIENWSPAITFKFQKVTFAKCARKRTLLSMCENSDFTFIT